MGLLSNSLCLGETHYRSGERGRNVHHLSDLTRKLSLTHVLGMAKSFEHKLERVKQLEKILDDDNVCDHQIIIALRMPIVTLLGSDHETLKETL